MKAESVYYSNVEPTVFLNAFSRQDSCLKIQQSKKQLFILAAFSRSEISKMTVRCSNNGEFLHQKVPLNTQWKILSPILISKNLSNAGITFFCKKKTTDWIYIMLYSQMSNFSEQNFTTEISLGSFVCVCKITQWNNFFT